LLLPFPPLAEIRFQLTQLPNFCSRSVEIRRTFSSPGIFSPLRSPLASFFTAPEGRFSYKQTFVFASLREIRCTLKLLLTALSDGSSLMLFPRSKLVPCSPQTPREISIAVAVLPPLRHPSFSTSFLLPSLQQVGFPVRRLQVAPLQLFPRAPPLFASDVRNGPFFAFENMRSSSQPHIFIVFFLNRLGWLTLVFVFSVFRLAWFQDARFRLSLYMSYFPSNLNYLCRASVFRSLPPLFRFWSVAFVTVARCIFIEFFIRFHAEYWLDLLEKYVFFCANTFSPFHLSRSLP